MVDPRPIASLGPRLLARKGAAAPALKTHMGKTVDAGNAPAAPVSDADFVDNEPPAAGHLDHAPQHSPVLQQQSELADRLGATADSVTQQGERSRRTAFTLRLDAHRHLRLKLASTMAGISAQELVTEALDRLLATMPEVEALAAQVAPRSHPSSPKRGNAR